MKNVTVEESQIKTCLLELDVPEAKASERAAEMHKELTSFVPAKYQEEVDYYLKHLLPSLSDVGQRILRLMPLHFDSFFDALVTLATEV